MEPDLDDLRAQLRAAQEAVEEIASAIPAQGWADAGTRDATADEVRGLVAVVQALRDLVPTELRDQIRELLRQLVLLLRAILDLVVERLSPDAGGDDGRPRGPVVQDIPIA